MFRVAVVGTGVVGSALALLLQGKGHTITGVCSKTGLSASRLAERLGCTCSSKPEHLLNQGEVVLLATPDRELEGVARQLAESGMVRENQVFFHFSGALPADILSPLKERGGIIGAIHPLQAFASVEKAVSNLKGSLFAFQGDERASEVAFQIIKDLEGKPFMMKKEDKPLYHLGACVASNYLVSLLHFAVSIYKYMGMSTQQAVNALMPLIRGTLANIESLGPVQALTGPVARGDGNTLVKHLEAIERLDSDLAQLYKVLGRYTIRVAVEKGSIDNNDAEELLNIFREREDKSVRR